jgi:pimeloyl-ACP methyl ester carboxylesterase
MPETARRACTTEVMAMQQADDRRPLEIRSPFDGSVQRAMLSLPTRPPGDPLPLVVAPHPFGWSVEEDYHGGCIGLKAPEHRGWRGVPTRANVAVLQPDGHHRAIERCSMGYEGVWRDVPAWIAAVEAVAPVDRTRIYASGLSMGGQESLLMAAHHPDVFAAAFVFNPVVDAAAWQEDLERTSNADLRAEGSDRLIVAEVGGSPAAVPDEYERRSVFGVLEGLRSLPISIWWSHLDLVVPRQVERHGMRLYDELKRLDPNGPVSEYNHTARSDLPPDPSDDQRWAIHETADYGFAVSWLLLHRLRRRPTDARMT